jgi:hypothetical protein
MDLVAVIEQELLTPLRELAESLNRQFPDLTATVFSGAVGSLTEYQGYHIGVDCLFANVSANQPDNVALSIDLQHLTTNPTIDAGVSWGHPSGHAEAEFSNEPLAVSESVLSDLYADIPRLGRALTEAAERGRPSDGDETQA